jgi:hypothetical protein
MYIVRGYVIGGVLKYITKPLQDCYMSACDNDWYEIGP